MRFGYVVVLAASLLWTIAHRRLLLNYLPTNDATTDGSITRSTHDCSSVRSDTKVETAVKDCNEDEVKRLLDNWNLSRAIRVWNARQQELGESFLRHESTKQVFLRSVQDGDLSLLKLLIDQYYAHYHLIDHLMREYFKLYALDHLPHLDQKLRKAVAGLRAHGMRWQLRQWLCLLFTNVKHQLPTLTTELFSCNSLNYNYAGVHTFLLVTSNRKEVRKFHLSSQPSLPLLLMFKDACDQYHIDWTALCDDGSSLLKLLKLGTVKDEAVLFECYKQHILAYQRKQKYEDVLKDDLVAFLDYVNERWPEWLKGQYELTLRALWRDKAFEPYLFLPDLMPPIEILFPPGMMEIIGNAEYFKPLVRKYGVDSLVNAVTLNKHLYNQLELMMTVLMEA